MTADEARELLNQQSPAYANVGRFYGAATGLALGMGLFYESIRFPLFDLSDRLFTTLEGLVYVLTHECDVEQANDRVMNEQLLVCPVLSLDAFLQEYEAEFSNEAACRTFLLEVGRRRVSRLLYLPPGPGLLSGGALLSLNAMASTHVSEFNGKQPIAALSHVGLRELDVAVANHFTRPKADQLATGWLTPLQ